jgi:hypothetical protein
MSGRTYNGEHKEIDPCCEAVQKIKDEEMKNGPVVRENA